MEKSKKMREKTTPILVIAEREEMNTLNTEIVYIGTEITNIPSLPTHQMSKWENEKNIENERKTPDSNILRLGEEREKSLNEGLEYDGGRSERRKTLPFILNGDNPTETD